MTTHLLAHAPHIVQAAHAVHAGHVARGLIAVTPTPHPTSAANESGPLLSGSGGASGGDGAKPAYDDILRQLLNILIFLANLIGGVLIGIAIVREALYYLYQLARHGGRTVPDKEAIRLSLGRSLALALEFQLGADILGTALNPSLQDLLVLAAIALLRTFLNYSLGREIDAEARRVKEARQGEGAALPTAGGETAMAAVRRTLDESTP